MLLMMLLNALLVVNKTTGRNYKTDTFKAVNTILLGGTNRIAKFSVLVVMCSGTENNIKFSKNLDNTYYSGLAEELHIEANKTVKLDNTDLEMLIEKYELLIKQLDT